MYIRTSYDFVVHKYSQDKEDQDDLLEVPFLDKDPSIVSTD